MPMAGKNSDDTAPVTIKKYANRRLYNTATSSYVTLDHLCQMVKDGVEFVVVDAKSGEDITRSVLTQIIVEEEGKGDNLLPISFLRQIISFYGDNMQRMILPSYLEHSMKMFSPMGGEQGAAAGSEQPDTSSSEDDTVADLQEKLNALQQQLNSMAKKSGQ